MSWLRFAVTCISAALPVALTFWLFRQVSRTRPVLGAGLMLTGFAAAAAAILAWALERWLQGWTGVQLASAARTWGAVVMVVLFVAMEEGLKMAAVWPSYLRQRFVSGRVGVLYAVASASSFAAAKILLGYGASGAREWMDVLRATLAVPAHLFFASLWGYALARGYRHWLPWLWLGVALLHGVYAHVVFGRGPALLVAVIPVLSLMVLGTWMMLRDGGEREAPALDESGRRSLFQPPSVWQMEEAMRGRGQPLMLHWIFFGALVTLGVTLTFLALAIYVGQRHGVDFAQIDEAELLATVPLAVLGAALLAAFPVSGYLVARASGARSVIEPAWATGAAIVLTLVMFSVTEPIALVVGASIAPVGFTLGCLGAWFGLDRRG